MRQPSKRILRLFAEAEVLGKQLCTLTAKEDRLLDELEQIWRWKAEAMAKLADKSREASLAEIAECLKRNAR